MSETVPEVPSSDVPPATIPSPEYSISSTPCSCCVHHKPWMKATCFELLTISLSIVVLTFSALSKLPAWAGYLIQCELFLFLIFFFVSAFCLTCLSPKHAFALPYQILQYFRVGVLYGTTLLVQILNPSSRSVSFLCLVTIYIPVAIFCAVWIRSTHKRLQRSAFVKLPPSYSEVNVAPPSYADYLRMYARKISNHVAPSDAPVRHIFPISKTVPNLIPPSVTEEETSLDYSTIPGTSDINAVKVVPDTKRRSSEETPVQLNVVLVQSSESAPISLLTKLTTIPED